MQICDREGDSSILTEEDNLLLGIFLFASLLGGGECGGLFFGGEVRKSRECSGIRLALGLSTKLSE